MVTEIGIGGVSGLVLVFDYPAMQVEGASLGLTFLLTF